MTSYYYLRIDDLQNGWLGNCGLGTPNPGDYCSGNIAPVTTSLTVNLPAGHDFKWWVSSYNSCGVSGPISTQVAFSVPPICGATNTPTVTLAPTPTPGGPTPTLTPTPAPVSYVIVNDITLNGVGAVGTIFASVNPSGNFTGNQSMTFAVANPLIASISPVSKIPAYTTTASALAVGSTTYTATITDDYAYFDQKATTTGL